jgi:transcriptional regulator with XRE-family HTH domain
MLDRREPVGGLLRQWRQRRRLSQLDLACDAGISTRHLSFVETGRAHPSRDMLLHLSEQLDVPVRERNILLVAAGRQWRIVASNAALPELYEGVEADLLAPPLNAMRLSLHPHGLAPRIVNLAEWRAHLLYRLRRQVELTADRALIDLLGEVSAYPAPAGAASKTPDVEHEIAVPFRIATSAGVLSFFSMTTVFGTPVDVMLSELALELFFPADDETASAVQRLAARARAAN